MTSISIIKVAYAKFLAKSRGLCPFAIRQTLNNKGSSHQRNVHLAFIVVSFDYVLTLTGETIRK